MAEQNNFLQVGEFSCRWCDFKCDGNDRVKVTVHTRTHLENLFGETLQDHDKRIRAEVLAACVARVGAAFESTLLHAQDKAFHQIIVDHLLASEPAASDLEALLREERIKELLHFVGSGLSYDAKVISFIDARLNELEKARASEGEVK